MVQLHGAAVWPDMSPYVVHFTREYGGKSAYDNLLGILSNRRIEARNSFGMVRHKVPSEAVQRSVCFSEIPLGLLKRLADHRNTQYGVVFEKHFVIGCGGNPILYAYKDGPVHSSVQALANEMSASPSSPFWQLAPFIDAPGTYGKSKYFFEWEREWRKTGDLGFSEGSVFAIISPENLHKQARLFFKEAREQNTGPSYEHHAFIDANWDAERLLKEYGI
ncbi:MAG TPA: abortive infection system antitoxin AbiGi family protein [Stellaceae bacterium]|jgi:hypothetical protein|nr:abortive infection system antitoxin AbiGi family protein [Stellaceae bacterium]